MLQQVLLSLMLASPPPVNTETIPVYDLEKLSWTEASHLDGKHVRVTFVVGEVLREEGSQGKRYVQSTMLGRSANFSASAFTAPLKPRKRVLIEGILRTGIIPPFTFDGKRFGEIIIMCVDDAQHSRP